MTIKVGDIVTWRSGKTQRQRLGKSGEPIGIANCRVMELGKTSAGEESAMLELPEIFDREMAGALVSDLEQ